MLALHGRPRTVQLMSIGRKCRRPIAFLTIAGVAATVIISVCLTITAQVSLHITVMRVPVTIGFEPLSRSWCAPGQMTVVGAVIPIKPTFVCSPIRPSINILGPIDIANAAALNRSTTPTPQIAAAAPSVGATPKATARASRVPKQTAHPQRLTRYPEVTPAVAIRDAEAGVRQGVSRASRKLLMWFRVWVYGPGLLECGAWATLCVLAMNLIRYALTRPRRLYRFRSSLGMVAVAMGVWLVLGTIAVNASAGLANAQTINQEFGTTVTNLDPGPEGPINTTSVGATIGNSVDSYFGAPGATAPCYQAPMAVAGILSASLGEPVKELDCSGATIANGLLGPQWHLVRGKEVAITPQIDELLNMPDDKFVVVSDGQNELGWEQLVGSCYVDDSCQSTLASAIYAQKLQQFALQYNVLLSALASLPNHPKILINLAYVPFSAAAMANGSQCSQTGVLTAGDIQAMVRMLGDLNHVLATGARQYGFATASPVVRPLCSPGAPAIQPIFLASGALNQYALHPLPPGEYAIAIADYQIISKWVAGSLYRDNRLRALPHPAAGRFAL